MFLPVCCAVCLRPGGSPCAPCVAELHRAPPLPPPPGLASCAALLEFEGPGRALVARLKYRNARGSLPWLAAGVSAMVVGPAVDVVTWAPTTPPRRRRRGFDQAELLARRVAPDLGCPAVRLLRRDGTAHQTGRSRHQRLLGPAIVALPAAARCAGLRVALVDDVLTTGATLTAAARALRCSGVGEVVGLVAARTPPPGHGPS